MAKNLDVLYLSRLDDMEEGWVAPLFVASHHPTIGVTGDPEQIIAMHWFSPKPNQHQQKKNSNINHTNSNTGNNTSQHSNVQMIQRSEDPMFT